MPQSNYGVHFPNSDLLRSDRRPLLILCADIFLFGFPRPRLGSSEPWTRLRDHTKSNAVDHRRGLIYSAARAGLRPFHASDLSDRGATDG